MSDIQKSRKEERTLALSSSLCFVPRRCRHCRCVSVALLIELSNRSSCFSRESSCLLSELMTEESAVVAAK
mgnify:FL=1